MVIAEVVSQHAEEAASLWLLRSDALRAPSLTGNGRVSCRSGDIREADDFRLGL